MYWLVACGTASTADGVADFGRKLKKVSVEGGLECRTPPKLVWRLMSFRHKYIGTFVLYHIKRAGYRLGQSPLSRSMTRA